VQRGEIRKAKAKTEMKQRVNSNEDTEQKSSRCSGEAKAEAEAEAEGVEGAESDATLRLDSCVDSLTWKANDSKGGCGDRDGDR